MMKKDLVITKMNKMINDLEIKNRELDSEYNILHKMNRKKDFYIQDLKKSRTYKIGRFITFPSRVIKSLYGKKNPPAKGDK